MHKNKYFEKISQLRKHNAYANAVKFILEYDLDTHWLRYNLMLIAYFETHPFEKDLFTPLGLDFGSSTRRVGYPGKCSFDWEWLSYQLKSLGYKFKSEDKAREAMVYLYKELAEQGYLEFEYNENEQDFIVFNVKNPIQKDKQMCKERGIADEETV